MVKAIKQAEDGEDIVIRAVELNGKATKCGIKLFGKAMKLDFKPYEIKTVKVNKNGEYKETNVLEL